MFSKLLRQILAPGCSLLVTFSVPPMQCRDIDCYIKIFQIDCSITNFLWNYIFDFVDVLLFDTTMHCKDLPRRINLDRTFCFSKPKQQFSKPKLKIYWGWRWLWFWEKTVCWSLVAWCTSNGVGGLGAKKHLFCCSIWLRIWWRLVLVDLHGFVFVFVGWQLSQDKCERHSGETCEDDICLL